MPAYLSEGIKYFRIAESHCDLVGDDIQNLIVSIVFSAMYMESVVNEVIFTDQLHSKSYKAALGRERETIELDIYNERESFENKVHLIMNHFGVD